MIEESDEESDEDSISKSFEESDEELDEMFKELTKIKSPNKDKNTTDWYDGFNHKNKIGKLRFNVINNLVNNIKNDTISEADAKNKINELSKKKKVEIKGKHLVNGQKILLNLFDDLVKAIFNNNKIVKEDNNKIVKEDNVNDNDNDNDDDHNYNYDNDEITVKEINNNFKKIDETKSFEDQIDILKKYHG